MSLTGSLDTVGDSLSDVGPDDPELPGEINDVMEVLESVDSTAETLKTEPPLTRGLSDEELDKIISTPWAVELPLSTTAVERAVKQVTAAASKSSDTFEQDGASFMAERARKRKV